MKINLQQFSGQWLRISLSMFVIFLTLSSGLCVATESFQVNPFTTFYLESALGTRTLEAEKEVAGVKSSTEAFLYSLVLPGAGQFYTGAKRGYLYAAAELGFLTTYFILRNNATNTRDEYRDVVRENVIFDGPGSFENWDSVEDFEHATQYENWNHVYDSQETRARTGKWYWKDLDPTRKDEEDIKIEFDSNYRLRAFELRERANNTFQRARTFLGLAILNHVISAVDARITTKTRNRRAQTQISNGLEFDVQTEVSAGMLGGMLVLRKRF